MPTHCPCPLEGRDGDSGSISTSRPPLNATSKTPIIADEIPTDTESEDEE